MKALIYPYIVLGALLCTITSVSAGQSPPPKIPPGSVLGPAQVLGGLIPGDNDGAVGRTYIVQKANTAGFTFTNRSTGQVTTSTDANFWPMAGPGGTTFTPNGGDGRILYDPYGPVGCSTGGGRWIAVERGQLCDTGCVNRTNAIILGVSTGEDPTPSNPLSAHWASMIYASPVSNPLQGTALMDQPRIGFNTNWIAAAVDYYDATNDSALYVWPKYQAECSANVTTSLFTVAALNTPTGASLSRACVAETYQTYGQDLDGSTLYLATPNDLTSGGGQSPTANSICISSITGTPQAPVYNANVSCPAETGSTWATKPPNLSQPGTTQTIDNSATDDRITSCVVRNYGIWAAQHVGLPATSPTTVAVQWWNVGVDNYLGSIYDFDRIGAGNDSLPDNAIYPSMGVNYYSDVLVGFTQVSSSTAPSSTYMYQDFRDGTQNSIYTYYQGLAPYLAETGPNDRLGDYSHTTDDPNDDFTLWTTEGFSHSLLTSSPNTYGWQSSYAFVYPRTTPYFVGYYNAGENECVAPPNCNLVFNVPPGSQPGDVLLVDIWIGDYATASQPSVLPPGWVVLGMSNHGGNKRLISSDAYGYDTSYLLAHVYQSTDPSQFTIGLVNDPGNGEVLGSLVAYRAGNSDLTKYVAYGYANTLDTTKINAGAVALQWNTTLVNLFVSDSFNENPEGVEGAIYTAPQGTPSATAETPLDQTNSGKEDGILDADVVVPSTGTYGPYSTTVPLGLNWAYQVVIPAQ